MHSPIFLPHDSGFPLKILVLILYNIKVFLCLKVHNNNNNKVVNIILLLIWSSKNPMLNTFQESLKALIGFVDVAGLYFALTQLTHRNISQHHKFQVVGLGWAFVDVVLHRLAPLWMGTRGLEFTWEYILQGLEANANLVFTVFLAALGSLMWLRKNKPRTMIPVIYACAGILATMPSITSYLRRALGWDVPKLVGFELFASLVMAFISWQLFSACLREKGSCRRTPWPELAFQWEILQVFKKLEREVYFISINP